MESLIQIGLANAAVAALLAICVALVTRVWKNPYLAHALWLIVLLRLVAPPIFHLPVSSPSWFASPAAAVAAPDAADITLPEPSAAAKGSGEPFTHGEGVPRGFRVDRDVDTPSTATSNVGPARDKESVGPDVPSSDPGPAQPSTGWPIRWMDLLSAVWIAGTLLYAGAMAVRVRRFAIGVRRAQVAAPSWLADEIREIAGSLGLRRSPRLIVVEGALPPMVWSGWRPTLLVPQTIVESIDASHRRLLLLHELLHIRRRDHLIRWFAVVVLALYWWNPFAWWAVRRLQNAEEECCDAAVLFFHPQQSETYGEALLAVSEFVSCGSLPAAAVSIGVERKNHLKRRMTMILKGSRWPRLSKAHLTTLIGCGAVLIGVSLTTAAAQVEPLTDPKPALKADSDKANLPPLQQAALIPAAKEPAAPEKTGLALYAAKPLTISPGDDELHKLLKQKYNAALAKMTYFLARFETGNASLGDLSAAAKSVLDAELMLDEKPPRDLEALERYLEFSKYLEKMAEARLSVGSAAGENPVLEVAQMREARLDAEIKLKDRRTTHAGGQSSAEAFSLPHSEAATESKSAGLEPPKHHGEVDAKPSASRPEALPTLLTAAPLKAEPGDDEIRKLLKDRYNVALAALQSTFGARLTENLHRNIGRLGNAARALLDTGLALEPNDQASIYERYLELMTFLDRRATNLLKVKLIRESDYEGIHRAQVEAATKLRQMRPASTAETPFASAATPPLRAGQAVAPAAERVPAWLTAKPLEAASGDDELGQLLKERYNAALKSLHAHLARAEIDSNISMTPVIAAARALLDAELAITTPAEGLGVYQRYLEFMKYFDGLVDKRWLAKTIGADEANAMHEARLDAEVKLRELSIASATKSAEKRAALVGTPEFTKRQILHDSLAFVQLLEVRVRIAEAEVNAVRAVVEQSEAELKRALANLKYREAQFGRIQSARKQAPNVISQDGFDEALRDRDAAAASVEAAKAAIHAAQAQVAIKAAQLEQVRLELKQAKEADNR
jgi:beta-lactamase regulating signal transducer with metallopeptidase domain